MQTGRARPVVVVAWRGLGECDGCVDGADASADGSGIFLGAALACLIRRSLAAPAFQPAERRVDPLPEVVQRSAQAAALARAAPTPRPAAPPPQPAPPRPAAQPRQQPGQHRCGRRPEAHSPIDAVLEAALNAEGVRRYEQIAAWTRADVRRIGQVLGIGSARINQDNWIEQAGILAKGGETHYCGPQGARRDRPRSAARRRGCRPRPQQQDASMLHQALDAAAAHGPRRRERAGCDAGAPAASVRPRLRHRPSVRRRLPRATTCSASAASRRRSSRSSTRRASRATRRSRNGRPRRWSASRACLRAGGRISRENWIEQAQILSRGGDTRFSREFDRGGQGDGPRPTKLADAIREQQARTSRTASTDLGSLRSVRRRPIRARPSRARRPRSASPRRTACCASLRREDLKRIRGIGVLIEKKLNSARRPHLRAHRQLDRAGYRARQPVARLQGPHRARELGRAGAHPGCRRPHRVLPPRRSRRGGDQPGQDVRLRQREGRALPIRRAVLRAAGAPRCPAARAHRHAAARRRRCPVPCV